MVSSDWSKPWVSHLWLSWFAPVKATTFHQIPRLLVIKGSPTHPSLVESYLLIQRGPPSWPGPLGLAWSVWPYLPIFRKRITLIEFTLMGKTGYVRGILAPNISLRWTLELVL